MTFKERFIGDMGFAPATLPAPQFVNVTDHKSFKQTALEKNTAKEVKLNHRKELREAYEGNIGRHLNIPSKELSISVVNTF